ncbi:MAG: hypothetical protein CL859_07875 [Cyanobium sp. ARS6]|nr:hypothetical protein [Cyanobium sp. ARS6]CAI8419756.1 MAG: Uncharacterised protein [Cyanobium sp. ARS6]
MCRWSVEKGPAFPQVQDGFPLPFPVVSRFGAEAVVLDSGAFRDLTAAPARPLTCDLDSF